MSQDELDLSGDAFWRKGRWSSRGMLKKPPFPTEPIDMAEVKPWKEASVGKMAEGEIAWWGMW